MLDLLVQKGLINDAPPDEGSADPAPSNIKRTQRQHIVDELVKTERTYVQHLELLQAFKKLVEEKGVVTGDAVHAIFLNLNALLDFQRRFLIRVEQTNAQPESEQNWGRLFVLYKEAFKVYEPFIANQKRCEETAMLEFEKLRETGGPPELRQMVESPTHLTSFLLKPFQRLSKYPLLLKVRRTKCLMHNANSCRNSETRGTWTKSDVTTFPPASTPHLPFLRGPTKLLTWKTAKKHSRNSRAASRTGKGIASKALGTCSSTAHLPF